MIVGWSKTRYSPIAIDFGADSLKLLQVIPTDPPQLVAAASVELTEPSRTDPAARHAFLTEAMKELLAGQPFKGRRAICSIPAYQTLIQHLQISRVEQEDFETQIGLHLRQRLNLDPSRMVVRHFEVGQVIRDGASKQEVICMAASRESVMRGIEIAHRAKLEVIGMQCEPVALLQAFAHLYRRAEDSRHVTCFIDIGAATTKVVIAHGSQMVFAKTIHAAGDHFTRHVAQTRGVGFAEARVLRSQWIGEEQGRTDLDRARAKSEDESFEGDAVEVLARTERPSGGLAILNAQLDAEGRPPQDASWRGDPVATMEADQGSPHTPAKPAVGSDHPIADCGEGDALDCLLDELQMCARYHQSMFPDRQIEKLVFVGGESRHAGLCQKIARSLRIGAQLGDPLARLVRLGQPKNPTGVDMRQPQPGWAVAMGLCLSETG